MKRHLILAAACSVALATATLARADSWMFQPSTYSHDPASGDRVNQFAPKKPAYARTDASYAESGYRHTQYTIRAGGTADRLHVVQTWGAGESIRPYGEWQFPYRAGATPYGPWGNPQGPWTTPFDSWANPYGQWNRFPNNPGWGGAYPTPYSPATPPVPAPPGPLPPSPGHP